MANMSAGKQCWPKNMATCNGQGTSCFVNFVCSPASFLFLFLRVICVATTKSSPETDLLFRVRSVCRESAL